MTTKLVNVKVKYIRPEYDNLKEWCQDPNNVYIGRKGVVFIKNEETGKRERYPKKDSIWANPYKINKNSTREEVVNMYREYISKLICDDYTSSIYINELIKLKGKTLGCWCSPESCHGDVLLELIEEYV